ncbi:hypothetical protein BDK51DRAFT_30003 [Blyttiomyces helicus]|uniref:Uncharacterized protein n=1 Tax=Blyttiomyces helicus TaxID=388810 RepID=A0A4P9WRJ0_9FUNG|nr:hypothetical protein BDK51DRAFT_30003 [Blyttiomyces helicus]|eukprot:RKO93536.1 hypothetical protein BDK51DRAFT_30003 [Blyttiomyces helicus]
MSVDVLPYCLNEVRNVWQLQKDNPHLDRETPKSQTKWSLFATTTPDTTRQQSFQDFRLRRAALLCLATFLSTMKVSSSFEMSVASSSETGGTVWGSLSEEWADDADAGGSHSSQSHEFHVVSLKLSNLQSVLATASRVDGLYAPARPRQRSSEDAPDAAVNSLCSRRVSKVDDVGDLLLFVAAIDSCWTEFAGGKYSTLRRDGLEGSCTEPVEAEEAEFRSTSSKKGHDGWDGDVGLVRDVEAAQRLEKARAPVERHPPAFGGQVEEADGLRSLSTAPMPEGRAEVGKREVDEHLTGGDLHPLSSHASRGGILGETHQGTCINVARGPQNATEQLERDVRPGVSRCGGSWRQHRHVGPHRREDIVFLRWAFRAEVWKRVERKPSRACCVGVDDVAVRIFGVGSAQRGGEKVGAELDCSASVVSIGSGNKRMTARLVRENRHGIVASWPDGEEGMVRLGGSEGGDQPAPPPSPLLRFAGAPSLSASTLPSSSLRRGLDPRPPLLFDCSR